MPSVVPLTYTQRYHVSFHHEGDVALLAASDAGIWAEEVYGDGWMAQHRLDEDGAIVESVDEDEGRRADLRPLTIPSTAVHPRRAWASMHLNIAGARHRGLREADRLMDVVHSLPIADKLAVAAHLAIEPFAVLGIAESYVLAECALTAPNDLMICRRLRIAVAVPAQVGADGLPFDYDTRELYLLQRWRLSDEAPPLAYDLNGLPGVPMVRPMDLLRCGDILFVGEGGAPGRASAVRALRIGGLPPPEDSEAALLRKLYG